MIQDYHSESNNSNQLTFIQTAIFTRLISCSHSRSSRSGSRTVCIVASSRYFSTLRWTIDSITSRSAITDVWNSSNDFHSSRTYTQHHTVLHWLLIPKVFDPWTLFIECQNIIPPFKVCLKNYYYYYYYIRLMAFSQDNVGKPAP